MLSSSATNQIYQINISCNIMKQQYVSTEIITKKIIYMMIYDGDVAVNKVNKDEFIGHNTSYTVCLHQSFSTLGVTTPHWVT